MVTSCNRLSGALDNAELVYAGQMMGSLTSAPIFARDVSCNAKVIGAQRKHNMITARPAI
jgi:hypothetical protein